METSEAFLTPAKGACDIDSVERQTRFTQLFELHRASLFRYIFSVVPNHADAHDILQETALALWRKFGDYDANRPFDAWARQFAYLQVLGYRKKHANKNWALTGLSDEALEALATEYESHEGVLQLRRTALTDCLQNLIRKDYELLKKRYWESSNLRGDARSDGVREHSVYRQLQRIRGQLRACIENRLAGSLE